MAAIRKPFKMGNSTVIAVPVAYLEFLRIKVGDYVSLQLDESSIRITKTETNLTEKKG